MSIQQLVMEVAYLSLGSNLGNRRENLERSITLIRREQILVTARSSIYEAEPQDVVHQPWFLNMVLECRTDYSPQQLLTVVHEVERTLGRVRSGAIPRGPRLIDIDIVLVGNMIIETPEITVPHPRMIGRRFVLEPLLEISPNLKHPSTHERLQTALLNLTGQTLRRLSQPASD